MKDGTHRQGTGRLVWLAIIAGCVLGSSMVEPTHAGIAPVTDDLWDISQGSVPTANSGVLYYSSSYRSDIRDMFGGNFAPVAPYATLFQDFQPAGTVHWVEWQTPSAVPIQSFNLLATHDGPPRDANYRGFSRFSLFGYNSGTSSYDKIFEIDPSNPYADTIAPPNAYVEPQDSANEFFLNLSANVPYTFTDKFRAEFVQYGDVASNASGPRVIELDGFSTPSPFVEQVGVIPEPASLALLALGLAGLAGPCRRRLRGPCRLRHGLGNK